MATSKDNDRIFIEINLAIQLHLEQIDAGILFRVACLAVALWTVLATQTRAAMSASHYLSATLVAWQSITWRSTRKATSPLMLTAPRAILNAGCTRLVAFLVALRMCATNLYHVRRHLFKSIRAVTPKVLETSDFEGRCPSSKFMM